MNAKREVLCYQADDVHDNDDDDDDDDTTWKAIEWTTQWTGNRWKKTERRPVIYVCMCEAKRDEEKQRENEM